MRQVKGTSAQKIDVEGMGPSDDTATQKPVADGQQRGRDLTAEAVPHGDQRQLGDPRRAAQLPGFRLVGAGPAAP